MSHEIDDYFSNPGSYCGIYPDLSFEGVLVERWEDGQLRYRGEFKKRGKRIGQHMCFYSNGVLQELFYWVDGYVSGTVMMFSEEGAKEFEVDFGQEGGKTNSYTQRYYSEDGELMWVHVYEDYTLVKVWRNPELEEVMQDIDVDEIIRQVVEDVNREL